MHFHFDKFLHKEFYIWSRTYKFPRICALRQGGEHERNHRELVQGARRIDLFYASAGGAVAMPPCGRKLKAFLEFGRSISYMISTRRTGVLTKKRANVPPGAPGPDMLNIY
jgi:hypothetical protein